MCVHPGQAEHVPSFGMLDADDSPRNSSDTVRPEEPPSVGGPSTGLRTGVSKGVSPAGSRRPRRCAPLSQARPLCPISPPPGLFLLPTPALQRPLCTERLLARGERLGMQGRGTRTARVVHSGCGRWGGAAVRPAQDACQRTLDTETQ
jgi:hypothetical protein